ncbi:MULE transposase [Hirsutella rhossiliensis]|uniref:MULE transposase domain-containing protein n=1 Tax=Hirsutella rhossiliensis TaxID=111463 RepID=A0A9P8MQI5_9HYPO|nr:MULE transposase domain-containing protein [Hirsutella rhossiliensis]KAH0959242.1 MULE transposase domain-containing protein [Hirsutella rhossiliensis]
MVAAPLNALSTQSINAVNAVNADITKAAFTALFEAFTMDSMTLPTKMAAPFDLGPFETADAAIEAIQALARDEGYAVVKVRSSNKRMGIPHRWDLACARGPIHHVSIAARLRESGTRKAGCPFKVKIVQMTTLDDLWHITVMCPEHNHGPEDPIAFPEHRKLTQAQIDEVELLSRDAAQTARTIHISLSVRNEGILTTEKDVTNLQTRRQMRELGARTSTQALVAKLDDIRIPHAETYNDEHLEKIVFLLDEGFEFWTRHSHLMMLDVTYNTNRFGLKLLEVNGITLSGSIFPLVACLSPDENGGIFEWALGQWKIWITEYALSLDLNDDAFYPHVVITDFDAAERWGIDRVFPLVQKQLCTWHIEKHQEGGS